MAKDNLEIEVKFYVRSLPALRSRLEELGAEVRMPRTHEVNLRYDTPSATLSQQKRVLRLRQDIQIRLTFKGPGELQEGVLKRQEIEFSVSDFSAAQAFLEALGYQVMLMYEKYRTELSLQGVDISLDEMPYGDFIELEAGDPQTIQRMASVLKLDWDARVLESYTALFDKLRAARGLAFRDLSFANFSSTNVTVADLNVSPADGG